VTHPHFWEPPSPSDGAGAIKAVVHCGGDRIRSGAEARETGGRNRRGRTVNVPSTGRWSRVWVGAWTRGRAGGWLSQIKIRGEMSHGAQGKLSTQYINWKRLKGVGWSLGEGEGCGFGPGKT